MRNKSQLLITACLIAILIIASFLRLHNFTSPANGLPPGLYPDEAMNGNNAVEALDNKDWKVFYPENFGREGLFINIQSGFIGLMRLIPMGSMDFNQPWVLRLPSAIFGILTVLGLYFLTLELFKDKKLALLAAFLLATSFWHISFSRIAFRAIMAPAFLTWSLYLLLRALRQVKNNKHSSPWYWLLPSLAGLVYGLGFHSYIAYRATPLLILVLMFIFWKQAQDTFLKMKFIKVFGIFILFTFLAGLPLGIYFLQNPADFLGRTSSISVFTSETPTRDLSFNAIKTLGMFNFFGDFNWRHNVAGKPLLFWPVGILFITGLVIAIKKSFKSEIRNWELGILLAWLVVTALPVVVSNEGLPHALRSLLMIPPVVILAAVGGSRVYEFLKSKINSRRVLVFGCWLFLSLLLYEAYFTYFIVWGQNNKVKDAFAYNDSVVARQLNELPKETPKYIVASDAPSTIERDNPISLQSILFLTDTFSDQKRKDKNFVYLNQAQFELAKIPEDSFVIILR